MIPDCSGAERSASISLYAILTAGNYIAASSIPEKQALEEKIMKKAIVCALALAMMLASAACGKTTAAGNTGSAGSTGSTESVESTTGTGSSSETTDTTQAQIKLIADNRATWLASDDTEPYSYVVTDLDGNGRLEITASSCQGTGLYTYSSVWEVSEGLDALTLIENPVAEGDSQADIIVNATPAYYDKTTDTYNYVFGDVIRNGAAEEYENIRAVSLKNGKLTDKCLASKSEIYNSENKAVVTYEDAEGNTLKPSEFGAIADKVFSGLDSKKASFKWIDDDDNTLASLDSDELCKLLEDSYRYFSVK
jgi:hypothetical protein